MIQRQKNKAKKCICKNISAGIRLFKIQISKIYQSGVFLGVLLSKIARPLMKVVPVTKNILAPLGRTAAACARDAGIQKTIWLWNNGPIISNK